jgi:transcriptional regulator with XRE-family HTH domain
VTKRLKQLKGKMTLRAFADRLDMGQSTLCNYLQGRDMPVRVLRQIILKTGCDPAWLLGLRDNKPNANYEMKFKRLLNEVKAGMREMSDFLKTVE